MLKKKTLFTAALLLLLLPVVLLPARSAVPHVSPAVDWLVANQDVSGLWGVGQPTPFRDATAVLEVLGRLSADAAAVQNGLDAVNGIPTHSCDYFARQIITIASCDDEPAPGDLMDSLAQAQNENGGWGFAPGYPTSSNLETALAVRALHSAGYVNTTAKIHGANYLMYHRNADYGWGFMDGDSSRVFYTAHVVLAMASMFDVYGYTADAAQDGVDWLKTQAHGDGGFGTGVLSNPYETGLALAAICAVDPAAPEATAARTFLETTQLPNGSWDDDAYSTAMALFGLISQDELQARSAALPSGMSLLGLPVNPTTPLSSTDLCALAPCCAGVTGWDRSGQDWLTGGFDVAVQDGFFLQTTTECELPFIGSLMGEDQCDTLAPNLNAISIPNENACYSAFTLMDDIDDCEEIHKWDQLGQKWHSAARTDGDTLRGYEFSIDPGSGYFIRRDDGTGQLEWCTRACDAPGGPENLPDLLITMYDIYLDPNPAGVGEVVTVAAMVHNIGTDTAHNPHIDFYLGDPDAGGSLMAPYDIPESIPPGGSASQFYGYGFTFGGCGIGEIYVVVDYADVIEELDENNNKAHRTLTISCSSPGTEGPLSLAGEQISKPGKFDRQPLSAGTAGVLPQSPLQPEKELRATITEAGATPTIDHVSVGGLSSSSATICWTTNLPVFGRVNYGTASVAEHSRSDSGWWGGYAHLVELDGLEANTAYLFEVVAGETVDNNGGLFYTFTTTGVGAGVPAVIYGQVLHEDLSPAAAANVTVILEHAGTESYALTCQTGWDGYWLLNLGNAKNSLTDDVLAYSPGDDLYLAAMAGPAETGGDTVSVAVDYPQNTGVITLGSCDCGVSGDMDCDGNSTPLDVIFLINYVYKDRDDLCYAPDCPFDTGDLNCDNNRTPLDVIFHINLVYKDTDNTCNGCIP